MLGLIGWLIQIDKGQKGLSKIQITKINFKICVFDSGKVIFTYMVKEAPVIKTREQLEKDTAKIQIILNY